MPVLVWDGRNHPRYHPPAGSGDDRLHRRMRRSTGTGRRRPIPRSRLRGRRRPPGWHRVPGSLVGRDRRTLPRHRRLWAEF